MWISVEVEVGEGCLMEIVISDNYHEPGEIHVVPPWLLGNVTLDSCIHKILTAHSMGSFIFPSTVCPYILTAA